MCVCVCVCFCVWHIYPHSNQLSPSFQLLNKKKKTVCVCVRVCVCVCVCVLGCQIKARLCLLLLWDSVSDLWSYLCPRGDYLQCFLGERNGSIFDPKTRRHKAWMSPLHLWNLRWFNALNQTFIANSNDLYISFYCTMVWRQGMNRG